MRLDHTRILFSYLSNFPLSEMEALKNATETWVNAAMNGNYSESMNARAAFYSTVANCVNNLVEHDFNYIEKVIDEEMGINYENI